MELGKDTKVDLEFFGVGTAFKSSGRIFITTGIEDKASGRITAILHPILSLLREFESESKKAGYGGIKSKKGENLNAFERLVLVIEGAAMNDRIHGFKETTAIVNAILEKFTENKKLVYENKDTME